MAYYSINISDNNSFMCSSADRVFEGMKGLSVCEACGYRTDFEYINHAFELDRKSYDLSATYDGYYIASLKFKECIQREQIANVEFTVLKNEPNYFVVFVREKVAFDTVKRKSRSENYCELCGNHESFVGATPAFLKEPAKGDLCRTDVMFGSGNAKHPVLIASEAFKELVQREKLQGIQFERTRT